MNSKKLKKLIMGQFLVFSGLLMALSMIMVFMSLVQVMAAPATVQAESNETVTSGGLTAAGDKSVGAGLAMGFAGAGAGIGLGTASAAAIGAITEKEEMFGKTIIYVGLIEGIAVFGFVVAFLILFVV